jgi:hypothetical protein
LEELKKLANTNSVVYIFELLRPFVVDALSLHILKVLFLLNQLLVFKKSKNLLLWDFQSVLYVHTEPQGSNQFQILVKSKVALHRGFFRLFYGNVLFSNLLHS